MTNRIPLRLAEDNRWRRLPILLCMLLILLPSAGFAGNFIAFGPESYTRSSGSPVTVINNFTVLNPNTTYTLRISNGGLTDGEFEKVSSSVISLNGVQIVGPSEFNQNVTLIEKPVALADSNQLSVELRGKPGGGITIQIIGVDDDPPTVTITSPANGATVSTSPVVVTGTTTDATSGIATVACNSAPASLSNPSFSCDVSLVDGPNTIVVEATDIGGNTNSASITVNKAQAEELIRVIVGLNVPWQPEGKLSEQERLAQRQAIAAAQEELLADLAATNHRVTRRFRTIPSIGLEVGADAMEILESSPRVGTITEDRPVGLHLLQSVPLVEADQGWAAGFDGTGSVVAILDTGVDKDHPFLAGSVLAEACFSSNGSCPDGTTEMVGPGAGVHCTYAVNGCRHGTHVGGIVAGQGDGFSGVAKGAGLIAIQVFSRFTGLDCILAGAGEDPCALSFPVDQIAALEHILVDLQEILEPASVNMSLGGGRFTDQAACDAANPDMKAMIDTLRAIGIATVIASGNNGFTDALSAPACISSAVSVGATTKADVVSVFSNAASFLALVAPGQNIDSAIPGGGFASFSGTSMAAPHVAGAWAILKQKYPAATVGQVLAALQLTALPIRDTRDANPRLQQVQCRIRINKALDNLPDPFVTFDAPAGNLGHNFGINKCQITGWVTDSTSPFNTHGFLLSGIGGEFTRFDVPNSLVTQAFGISNTGHIVGRADVLDQTCCSLGGFVRLPNGSFDSPIKVPDPAVGTMTVAINDSGQHVGWWIAPQPPEGTGTPFHGLLRLPDGTIQTIDKPGAADTQFYGINNLGQIVGIYSDQAGFPHGFLRLADGTYQEINCPGAIDTSPIGINDSGYIVGTYATADFANGFIRSSDGTCTIIDAGPGTFPWAINNFGQVVGSSSNFRGFVYNSLPQ